MLGISKNNKLDIFDW